MGHCSRSPSTCGSAAEDRSLGYQQRVMRDEELLELLVPAHSCPRHRTLEREIDVAVLDIDLADTLDADALRAISPKLTLGQAR